MRQFLEHKSDLYNESNKMLLNPKISNKILWFRQKQHTGILVVGFFCLNKKSRLPGYLSFHWPPPPMLMLQRRIDSMSLHTVSGAKPVVGCGEIKKPFDR
jgi:hypothetical protein